MRTIPAPTLTKLQQDYGTEPIVVLEVFWSDDSTSRFYADKTIAGTPVIGRILQMSDLDEIVQVSGGGRSQQLSVTLDDNDGEIKGIFDVNDVHKKSVRVWFYIEGTNFDTDKFSVFKGQINSPVIWSEGDRTFSFSIINRIEDVEVGFSAEEGQFDTLPEDLIGKTWPLVFGTCINVPALKAVPAVSGSLAGGVGISDFTLPRRIALAELITCSQQPIGFICNTTGLGTRCDIAYETDQNCLQARCVEIERLGIELREQREYEYQQITIFGGKNFPQGRRITLNINGGLFTGMFTGTKAIPTEVFQITSRKHPLDDGTQHVILDDVEQEVLSLCPGSDGSEDSDYVESAFGPLYTGVKQSRLSWEKYRNERQANFFWAGGGSTVTIESGNEIVYVANILPSTILRVAAWRTVNGNRFLLTVPRKYFTIRQTNYTGYNVMEIVFRRPLSAEGQDTGGGWTDDIYVTMTSSVGPNTVDILRWFIETYTDYAIDSSFTSVRTKIDNYPTHFPLLQRKNLLTVLQEIAAKSRCALWQKDDTFFIRYLSEEPTPVATITEDDVLEKSLEIELSKTEDVFTKVTAEWKKDHSESDPNKLILRHNVKKYGVLDRTEDYYIYAHLDLVRKSATYWLIQSSNTWKLLKMALPLEFLGLEAFDAVTVSLPDVASSDFLGIVQRAIYNSAERQVEIELWTPIRAGESLPYDFAWPAAISENALFPTIEARNAKLAGSGSEPGFSTVAPPGHPLNPPRTGVYSGMSLACNGDPVRSSATGECRQDHGDQKPSDIGDQKPTVDTSEDQTGEVSGGTSPITNGAGTSYSSTYKKIEDATKKANTDAGLGQEQAQRAVDKSGADSSKDLTDEEADQQRRNLPDPDELDDDVFPCQVRVTVSGFKLRQVTCCGNQEICLPASGQFTETFVFNDCDTAQAFADGIQGTENCSQIKPCTQCAAVVMAGCNCSAPEGQPAGMIAYRNSSPDDTFA